MTRPECFRDESRIALVVTYFWKNLEKVTHRGVIQDRPFQRLLIEQKTIEKVQQEENSFKPFQGKQG